MKHSKSALSPKYKREKPRAHAHTNTHTKTSSGLNMAQQIKVWMEPDNLGLMPKTDTVEERCPPQQNPSHPINKKQTKIPCFYIHANHLFLLHICVCVCVIYDIYNICV